MTNEGHDTLMVYCRSWCGDCMRAKRWLDQRSIPYVEVDVEKDPAARQFAASLNDGDLHTPTFVCANGSCVDFDPKRLEELLGLH